MASKKKFWRRNCDKSYRNNGRRSYWSKELNDRREVVEPGTKCIAAPTGARPPRAPKFFCARPRALHFGIA